MSLLKNVFTEVVNTQFGVEIARSVGRVLVSSTLKFWSQHPGRKPIAPMLWELRQEDC